MSGHSKWATIKRKKEKTDSARGKMFSKLIKEITIAARTGSGDVDSNPRLRTAVETAKSANMPAVNIDRAIKKGTGELPGVNYEEVLYEAYGPGGTAILIEVLTDNRNRTLGEIRFMLTKHNGNMGENGSVSWMFSRLGMVLVPVEGVDEDELLMVGLDAGADDIKLEDDYFHIISPPEKIEDIRTACTEAGYTVESAEVAQIPQTYVKVEGAQAKQMIRLIDAIEDHDDVQKTWSNCDIPEEMLLN